MSKEDTSTDIHRLHTNTWIDTDTPADAEVEFSEIFSVIVAEVKIFLASLISRPQKFVSWDILPFQRELLTSSPLGRLYKARISL